MKGWQVINRIKKGYMGSARTLRRYVSRLKRKHGKRISKPFETEPGHQAMVDLQREKATTGT